MYEHRDHVPPTKIAERVLVATSLQVHKHLQTFGRSSGSFGLRA